MCYHKSVVKLNETVIKYSIFINLIGEIYVKTILLTLIRYIRLVIEKSYHFRIFKKNM